MEQTNQCFDLVVLYHENLHRYFRDVATVLTVLDSSFESLAYTLEIFSR